MTGDPSTGGRPTATQIATNGEQSRHARLDANAVPRPQVVERLAAARRLRLLVAPAGYGKTVAAHQWVGAAGVPAVWVDAERVRSTAGLWGSVLAALAATLPGVAVESKRRLPDAGEPGAASTGPVEAVVAAIERSGRRAVLVLDGLTPSSDSAVLDDIVRLVEHGGDRLSLLITSRAELDLPIARWGAAGWAVELTEEDLYFDPDDALAVAARLGVVQIGREAILSLNGRVDGWPAPFQLALRAVRDHGAIGLDERTLTVVDRSVATYVKDEVVASLGPSECDIARSLSVVSWFDAELGRELAGPASGPGVVDLRRRRLLVRGHGEHDGNLRFPVPLRRLLEDELRWQQPDQHAALHRVAAAVMARRGALNDAYRHLATVDARDAQDGLVVEPALDRFQRGDRDGLADLILSLPAVDDVDEPGLGLDIALTWLLAGSARDAARWCEHAASSSATSRPLRGRLSSVRAAIALLNGEIDTAAAHVEAFRTVTDDGCAGGPFERRVPLVAACCLLAAGDRGAAAWWLDRARASGAHGLMDTVTLPGLMAWLELESGRLRLATETAETALAHARTVVDPPHLAVIDAAVTAVRCSLYNGDLDRARARADAARHDADDLQYDWGRIRSGMVAAEIELLVEGPSAASAVAADVRSGLDHPGSWLARQLDVIDAKALQLLGRLDDARDVAARLGDGPAGRLRRASIALETGEACEVALMLDGSDGWSAPLRFEADALRAAADPADGERMLAATLERAAASSWTTPFLGLGAPVDNLLHRMPLERLHPRLARHVDGRDAEATIDPVIPGPQERSMLADDEVLTPRERTILELLPSHLSYAEIGEQLHISINTVKPNVKAVYRKLGVTSRGAAVDAARRVGLI